jgi:hypothetical protein
MALTLNLSRREREILFKMVRNAGIKSPKLRNLSSSPRPPGEGQG